MITDVEAQLPTARIVPRGTPGSVGLLEFALHNAGMIKGGRGVGCLWSWAIAVHRSGHDLAADVDGVGHVTAAVREYAKYWRQSERTAWRELDAFRKAFPGQDTPAAIASQLVAQYRDRVAEMEKQRSMPGTLNDVAFLPA